MFFFHRLCSSAPSPTTIVLFNSGFVYLRSRSICRKEFAQTFAPRSESDTDYFIMGVYLTAGLGLYGPSLV